MRYQEASEWGERIVKKLQCVVEDMDRQQQKSSTEIG